MAAANGFDRVLAGAGRCYTRHDYEVDSEAANGLMAHPRGASARSRAKASRSSPAAAYPEFIIPRAGFASSPASLRTTKARSDDVGPGAEVARRRVSPTALGGLALFTTLVLIDGAERLLRASHHEPVLGDEPGDVDAAAGRATVQPPMRAGDPQSRDIGPDLGDGARSMIGAADTVSERDRVAGGQPRRSRPRGLSQVAEAQPGAGAECRGMHDCLKHVRPSVVVEFLHKGTP